MKTIKLFFLFTFFIFTLNLIQAQDVRNLTIEECVELGIKNNFDIQKSQFDVLTTREVTKQYKAQYEPSVNASIGKSKTKNSEENSFMGTNIEKDSMGLGVNKKFYNSGGNLNFNILNEKDDSDSFLKSYTGSPNPSYSSSMNLAYSQPLLKNYFGTNDRKYMRTSEIAESISALSLILQKNFLANAIEKAYLDLNFAHKNLETQKVSLERSKKLLKINKQKLRDGLIEEVDVIATEAAVRLREASILLAGTQVENAEDLLKNLIGLSADCNYTFIMQEKNDFKHQPLKQEGVIKTALSQRPDIKIIENNILVNEIQNNIKKNEAKASLSLDTSYTLSSYSDSFKNAYDSLLPSWYLGFSMNLFPFNKLGSSSLKQTQYSLEKNKADLEYKKLAVITECRDIVRRINTQALYVYASHKALLLQEKKLALEEKKFNQGRSSIKWLLTFQDDLSNAEIGYQKALIDYYKAQSDLRLIIGK